MDSARVFRKYLTARVRAERMSVLSAKQRHPPLQRYNHSYSRLPAGGRLSESLHLNLNRFSPRRNDCYCKKEAHQCPVVNPHKPKSKLKIKYKNPVLVVPSRPRLYCSSSQERSEGRVHFSRSPLREGKRREQETPLSCPIAAQSGTPMEPKERHISFTDPAPPFCVKATNEMPQITKQLTTLMQKLEDQLACEKKQKEELNAINVQLKQLSGNVSNLNDKYKQLETEKSKLNLEQLRCQSLEVKKVCHKPSSMCQFCQHQQLPVLSSMHNALFQLMGSRLFTDVALTILLRADNVYHVNVRDLETGKVLGCLLVNEEGIKEANSLGIFQEMLTFCVIDVRSSMNTRDAIFGGINFEFVRNQRLSAGNNSERKQLFKDMHNPISSLQADQAVSKSPKRCKSKSKLSVSQAMLQIGSISKSLVLSDEEAKYPVSGIEIVSMMESSPDGSEADQQSAS
ncbi:hypothetical protein KR093_002323 [Drosophila rubida]|uniref:Uncharacterized protein n=1 Tax=Drosophila rubida TaxID=30044 RepID=A0AAD4K3N7_9MUSC|nr:hypothetical protein KR093_002323 [Drosophila rubida]